MDGQSDQHTNELIDKYEVFLFNSSTIQIVYYSDKNKQKFICKLYVIESPLMAGERTRGDNFEAKDFLNSIKK